MATLARVRSAIGFLAGALAVGMALGLFSGGPVLAQETALERIARTGQFRVGMREDAAPFAYIDESGQHVGFSVDMAYLLAEKLGEYAGRPIEVIPVTVTPQTRIPLVVNGTIDIEMGSTSKTAARQLQVDFSLPFFVSETVFMVRADSGITTLSDLTGKAVGAASGTTNLKALRENIEAGVFNPSNVVVVDTHSRGVLALRTGRVDAYFTDASLLVGLRGVSPNPAELEIIYEAIHSEPYGWLIPKGDATFRDFVDHFIIWTLETGIFYEIYDKWMGPGSRTPIPRSSEYEALLKGIQWPGVTEVWPRPPR